MMIELHYRLKGEIERPYKILKKSELKVIKILDKIKHS